RALGGEAAPWPGKTECCGASLSITRTQVVWQLAAQLLSAAQGAGAEAIVVACPFCQSNLDMRQVQAQKWSGRHWGLPVYYFTQLLGVALGLPLQELGLNTHFVDPLGILRQKALA
ncbi:MAG TPA: heterodisulfide reductase subunit B, partial [Firmicutes bacterium]|nr:heterodisulfide reductase subunit B [Bacillota bacterium]